MNNLIADAESGIRLSVFIGLFMFLAIAEYLFPRRKLAYSKVQRWLNNIAISAFNTLVVRIIFPIAGIGAALLAQEHQWGFFNLVQTPAWLSILIFLFVFDLAIYWQHRLFHAVPLLWRFHRMHHTDLDYDLTTGSRFHPVSILISSFIKLVLVVVMGASVAAILIAEVLLNATAMFNHSNLSLPTKLDRVIRRFLVTPDMHRIHHSTDDVEHSHNFGFNFPWWDRLFGTYLDQPKLAHENLDIGILGMQDKQSIHFFWLLLQPFRNNVNNPK